MYVTTRFELHPTPGTIPAATRWCRNYFLLKPTLNLEASLLKPQSLQRKTCTKGDLADMFPCRISKVPCGVSEVTAL